MKTTERYAEYDESNLDETSTLGFLILLILAIIINAWQGITELFKKITGKR